MAFSGSRVAVIVAFPPATKVTNVGSTYTPMTGTSLAATVSVKISYFPPQEAKMSTVPALRVVTSPVWLTVAMDSLPEDQVTVLSVASAGRTLAVSLITSPTSIFGISGVMMLTSVTGTTLEATVTSQVAVLLPSTVVAVMVAEPSFRAVTSPSSFTVAIVSSEEDQLTILLVAVAGRTVAVRLPFPPSFRERVAGATVTPVTAISPSTTVSVHEAVLPPQVAVIVTVPGFRAVTRPLSMTATLLSEEVQDTGLEAASAGNTVAVIWRVLLTTISAETTSSSTAVTVTSGLDSAVTVTGQEANFPPREAVMEEVPSAIATTVPSEVT